MAVVREISVKHCKKVRICDDAYANLSDEEIKKRQQHIRDHVNLLARKQRESSA